MRSADRALARELQELAGMPSPQQQHLVHLAVSRLRELGKRDVPITKAPPILAQGGPSITPVAAPTGPTIPARNERHASR